MNETTIIKRLRQFFATSDYDLANVFIYEWESDFFCITKSGYAIEVEVKISKSDFKADQKKTAKHLMLKNATKELLVVPGYEFKNGCVVNVVKPKTPNKFYYCCPKGMLLPEDMPEYAGLLYYHQVEDNENEYIHRYIEQVKPAKFLHKIKYDLSKILLEKYYYMYINLRQEYTMLIRKTKELRETYNPNAHIQIAKHINESKYFEPELFADNLNVESKTEK